MDLTKNSQRLIRRFLLIVSLSLILCSVAFAESRYQAIPLHPGYEFGSEKALILDTVAGHMWIWVESPAIGKRDGGRYVIYQGQLTPGREMGDIMAEQHWPPNNEAK
jgi:hypothetical protein